MKRVLILMFLFAILVTSLFAQEESGNSSLFPEQIVFRSLHAGIFTAHTSMIFLYPAIPETQEGRYIYWYNSYLCHQMFERSFFIGDYPLAVCARCTGINLGKVAGSASFLFREGRGELSGETLKDSLISCGLHGLMILPMAADGLIQKYTEYESDNAKRLVTGLMYGYGLTVIADEAVWMASSFIRSLIKD